MRPLTVAVILSAGCHHGAASESDAAPEIEASRPDRPSLPEATPRRDAPSAPNSPVIVAVGDIACDPITAARPSATACRERFVADLVAAIQPVAILGLGDMQYEDGQYDKYLASYDLTWGRFKAITRPTPGGSHDAYGAGGYYQYFGTNAGPSANQTWYSFDIGNWHLVSLNGNCTQVPGNPRSQCVAGSAQREWLVADLKANTKPCTIAYIHYPRWNAGQFADDARLDLMVRDLYAAGAELLLAGHDHDYQRYAPLDPDGQRDDARGIRSFVVGTGGKNLMPSMYTMDTKKPNLEVSDRSTFGVLKLTLRSDGYDWAFVPEAGKTFTDSGTGRCH